MLDRPFFPSFNSVQSWDFFMMLTMPKIPRTTSPPVSQGFFPPVYYRLIPSSSCFESLFVLAPDTTGISFTTFSHQLDGPRWPCLSLLLLLSFSQPSVSDKNELHSWFPRSTLIAVAQMITGKKQKQNGLISKVFI